MTNEPVKILLVDDDEALRRMTLLFAKMAAPQAEFHEAGNVTQEKAKLAEHAFALMYTDNTMPGGMGMDLVHDTRTNPAIHQPKIIMATTDTGNVEEDAMEAGVNVFLHKPFEPQKFINSIRELLATQSRAPVTAVPRPAVPTAGM